MSDQLKPLIGRAADGPLTRDEAVEAFEIIMSGQATPALERINPQDSK